VLRGLRLLCGGALLILLPASACVDRLPAEDRRITIVQPVAKLSAADLWQDYQKDQAAANQRYFAGAVEVTGKVTAVEPASPSGPVVMFGQTEAFGVRAILLGDVAADIIKTVKVNDRLTLKCFCEGRTPEGHVSLRSCIKP
jgi:hypothetical protein